MSSRNFEQLCLEEAFEDSPQMRNFVLLFQEDCEKLKTYSTEFQGSCQRLFNAQMEVTAATHQLSSVAKKLKTLNLPLDRDDGTTTSMAEYATYLDKLSSLQELYTSQLNDSMLTPINKLVSEDFEALQGLSNMYTLINEELDNSQHRYMRLPKRCTEKAHADAVDDVFQMRRKFHVSAMQYYTHLNALQYKRQFVFLEALSGVLREERDFVRLKKETLDSTQLDDYLEATKSNVECLKRDYMENRQRTEELVLSIDEQSCSVYFPDAPTSGGQVDANATTVNPCLTKKAGYLMLRIKTGLLQSRWVRAYFYTQGGNLMTQLKDEMASSLILDLNDEGVYAETTDCDDRRNVFQLVSPVKRKNIVLQAENEKEKNEWIATITNIAMDEAYRRPSDSPSPATNSPLKERSASSFFSNLFSTSNPQPTVPQSPTPPCSLQQLPPNQHSTQASHQSQTRASNILAAEEVANWLAAQPIQFDLAGSVIDQKIGSDNLGVISASGSDRVNPFDQEVADESAEWFKHLSRALLPCSPRAPLIKTFPVRFLGSVNVPSDRGEHLVTEVIRHIMGARAVHNMFRMSDMVLVVSNEGLWLVEPGADSIREVFRLENVAFWSNHKENNRMFGFITRIWDPTNTGLGCSFTCLALECDSGDQISAAIRSATKIAFQIILEQRENEGESGSTVMSSHAGGIDTSCSGPNVTGDNATNSDDKKATDDLHDSARSQLGRHSAGDGDERKVEGAECEADT